ncbi:MAG: sulfatase activating formylglycine-generating enzyme [Myxococcota bacterium]|jgi:formylglycine-generating enzyme required for sulfatase activity/tRNA A-37 threonylcarbamoyl transferase component Bud32
MNPGDTIERYVVEAMLGEGGMARVYRVRHLALGSLHALKVLHPHLLTHDEIRQRFIAEGRIQARLRHPHLVPVTDIISQPGMAGLVMDLLVGEDLEDRLRRGAVEVETARQWTRQALSALAFVHDNGIVHRDIKPANLFIEHCADGERRLRVMDFGIARDTEAARTAVTTQMGTVGYMSPEQILRPKTVDARSDLFSLGAVLYEMLTGAAPFAADSAFSAQQEITAGRFPDPVGVPAREAAVIRRALRVDRGERYPSAAAFAADLAPPAVVERSRWGVALAGAALVGLLGVLMLAVDPPPPLPPIDVPDYPMVSIAPDTVTVGSPVSERGRGPDEAEVTVTLTRPFAIGITEVSQALYRSVMHDNPSFQIGDALPVERVTWVEAVRLANALSAYHGLPACYRIGGAVTWTDGLDCMGYRLPTEAEWEVAARAGERTPYASGADVGGVAEVGWSRLSAGGHSQPVGQLSANDWGLLDMHGNVAEWCWDRYGKTRYDATDPMGAATGRYRVIRGGSWSQPATAARSASRDRQPASRRHRGVGLRLVRSLPVEG